MLSAPRIEKSAVLLYAMYLGCHQPKKRLDILMDIPAQESEFHLAPDHVHAYVESDAECFVEEIAKDMKRFSAQIIFQ
jgi:hypothetical protein